MLQRRDTVVRGGREWTGWRLAHDEKDTHDSPTHIRVSFFFIVLSHAGVRRDEQRSTSIIRRGQQQRGTVWPVKQQGPSPYLPLHAHRFLNAILRFVALQRTDGRRRRRRRIRIYLAATYIRSSQRQRAPYERLQITGIFSVLSVSTSSKVYYLYVF